eukprot:INCI12426.2.p1 GENE.INCI12426.2~~INCI12426.2.p1  ORF type:complete len:443 (-),score=54.47 INCI12426.2:197-1525(-)
MSDSSSLPPIRGATPNRDLDADGATRLGGKGGGGESAKSKTLARRRSSSRGGGSGRSESGQRVVDELQGETASERLDWMARSKACNATWHLEKAPIACSDRGCGDPDRGCYSLAKLDPESNTFASGGADGTVRVFDWDDGGKEQWCLRGHTQAVTGVKRLDKELVVSTSMDMTSKIFTLNREQFVPDEHNCIATVEGHKGAVLGVETFSGRRFATCSMDATIRIWDGGRAVQESYGLPHPHVHKKSHLATLKGHEWQVNCVTALSQTALASGSHDNTIKIWDLFTNKCIGTLVGHRGYVWSVAKLRGSMSIATGGSDNKIKIWDLVAGECVASYGPEDLGHERAMSINSLCSLDSRTLASAGADAYVKLWDLRMGKMLRTLAGGHHKDHHHVDTIRSICRMGSRLRIVSGGDDGLIRMWQGDVTRRPDEEDVITPRQAVGDP